MNRLDFLQIPMKNKVIPLNLLTIGSNDQPQLNRPVGLPYHQIFLATKGRGVFRIFGIGDFELRSGEAIIVLKETSHEYFPISKGGWELGFVGFDGELADLMLSQLKFKEVKKLSIQAHAVIWESIEQLWTIAKENDSAVQWRTSERIYSLLLKLKRLSELGEQAQQNDYNEHPQNTHVRKVAEFIRENYSKDLTVSHLADIAGYSAHHFTRIFKSTYKQTPHQFIMDIRLKKSKFLLEQNIYLHLSVVAHQVGMEENYFIRLFRKKYGITPGAYREKFALNRFKN